MRTLLRRPLVRTSTDCLCLLRERLIAIAMITCASGVGKQGQKSASTQFNHAQEALTYDDEEYSCSCRAVYRVLGRVRQSRPASDPT